MTAADPLPGSNDAPLALPLAGLRDRACALVAALLAVALYLPALGFGFVFDDVSLIGGDGRPVALGGWIPYRPLRFASYWIDGRLGGSPVVYHAHNLLLHGLVTALVVCLARRLGSALLPAMAGGLLVAFHPLAVEAVAYVAGRRDLLCVALGVAALHEYQRGRSVFALLLLLLSSAAKESGILFAAPLAAMAVANGAPAAPKAGRRLLAVAAASLASLLLVVAYQAIGPWLPGFDAGSFDHAARVALHYAAGLLLLRPLRPEYPQLLAPTGDAAWAGAVFLLSVTALAAASLWLGRRSSRGRRSSPVASDTGSHAWIAVWLACSIAALSIYGGLHEPGADRHAYLLLPALAVSLALAATKLGRAAANFAGTGARPVASIAAAALLLLTLGAATRSQMQVWRDDRSLWTHAVAGSAHASPRAMANLARAVAAGGELEEASRHLNRGLAASPQDPDLFLGRAALRCAQGRHLRANNDLRRARRFGADAALVAAIAGDCPLPRRSPAARA